MKKEDLFKSSLVYGFSELRNNFFSWIGHYLKSIFIGLVLPILPIIFCVALGYVISFLAIEFGHVSLPQWIFRISFLVSVLTGMSLFFYAQALFIKNALYFYDNKKFPSNFFMPLSISASLLLFIEWMIIYVFIIPGFAYLIDKKRIMQYLPVNFTSIGFFLLLSMVIGLYVFARFALATYMIIDTKQNMLCALKKSWTITQQYQNLFLAQQVLFFVTLMVPVFNFFTVLFFTIVRINLYRTLSQEKSNLY